MVCLSSVTPGQCRDPRSSPRAWQLWNQFPALVSPSWDPFSIPSSCCGGSMQPGEDSARASLDGRRCFPFLLFVPAEAHRVLLAVFSHGSAAFCPCPVHAAPRGELCSVCIPVILRKAKKLLCWPRSCWKPQHLRRGKQDWGSCVAAATRSV